MRTAGVVHFLSAGGFAPWPARLLQLRRSDEPQSNLPVICRNATAMRR